MNATKSAGIDTVVAIGDCLAVRYSVAGRPAPGIALFGAVICEVKRNPGERIASFRRRAAEELGVG